MTTIDVGAGYRGTSPPHVLVAQDIDELLGSKKYEDVFDLKNTLVSFKYSLKGGSATIAELQLINPSAKIEKKLFSIYAAITSTSYASKSHFTGKQLQEEIGNADQYYIRWGYDSPSGQGTTDIGTEAGTSMSHIHRFNLYNMKYEYTPNRDRIVTLQLMDTWHFHLENPKYLGTGRTFVVPMDKLVGGERQWRPCNEVVEDALMQMLTGLEGWKGVSLWTPDQRAKINADYEAHVTYLQATAPPMPDRIPASVDPSNQVPNAIGGSRPAMMPSRIGQPNSANWTATHTWDASSLKPGFMNWTYLSMKAWFENLGGTVVNIDSKTWETMKSPPGKPAPMPRPPLPALAGTRVAGTAPSVPAPAVPAEVQAGLDAAQAAGALPPARYLTVSPIEDALGKFRRKIAKQTPNPLILPQTVAYYSPPEGRFINPADLTLDDLREIQRKQKYRAVFNEPAAMFYKFGPPFPVPGTTPRTQWTAKGQDMLEPLVFVNAPGTIDMSVTALPAKGDPDKPNVFDFTPLDEVYIDELISAEESRREELLANSAYGKGTPAQRAQADRAAVLSTMAAIPLTVLSDPHRDTKYDDSINHLVINVPPNQLLQYIKAFIKNLNDKFFKDTPSYVRFEALDLAEVKSAGPEAENMVKTALGGIKSVPASMVDWKNDLGIVICSDHRKFKDIFSFTKKIKSFPGINVDPDNGVISMSVGYGKRSDGIVTDVKWKMPYGTTLMALRQAPMVSTKYTSMVARFEGRDPARDDVAFTLASILSHASNIKGKVNFTQTVDSNRPDLTKLGMQTIETGDVVFPASAIKYAVSQTDKITAASDNDPKVVALLESLAFILKNDLFDKLFPRLSDSDASIINQTYIVASNEAYEAGRKAFVPAHYAVKFNPDPGSAAITPTTKTVPHFRYLTKTSPGTTPGGDVDIAAAIASRMQALNVFKKTVVNLNVETLGVPEMDVLGNEIGNRTIQLAIHEPRDPGTVHWISGLYNILGMEHSINTVTGYTMSLTLFNTMRDTEENWVKYTFEKD